MCHGSDPMCHWFRMLFPGTQVTSPTEILQVSMVQRLNGSTAAWESSPLQTNLWEVIKPITLGSSCCAACHWSRLQGQVWARIRERKWLSWADLVRAWFFPGFIHIWNKLAVARFAERLIVLSIMQPAQSQHHPPSTHGSCQGHPRTNFVWGSFHRLRKRLSHWLDGLTCVSYVAVGSNFQKERRMDTLGGLRWGKTPWQDHWPGLNSLHWQIERLSRDQADSKSSRANALLVLLALGQLTDSIVLLRQGCPLKQLLVGPGDSNRNRKGWEVRRITRASGWYNFIVDPCWSLCSSRPSEEGQILELKHVSLLKSSSVFFDLVSHTLVDRSTTRALSAPWGRLIYPA